MLCQPSSNGVCACSPCWASERPSRASDPASRDRSGKIISCVQLVRGSNDAQAPEPGTTIGPRVAAQLRPLFSWANYWEINRQQIPVASGEKVRVRLNSHREVEIDLTTRGERTVAAFSNSEPVPRLAEPIGGRMTIIGGD